MLAKVLWFKVLSAPPVNHWFRASDAWSVKAKGTLVVFYSSTTDVEFMQAAMLGLDTTRHCCFPLVWKVPDLLFVFFFFPVTCPLFFLPESSVAAQSSRDSVPPPVNHSSPPERLITWWRVKGISLSHSWVLWKWKKNQKKKHVRKVPLQSIGFWFKQTKVSSPTLTSIWTEWKRSGAWSVCLFIH